MAFVIFKELNGTYLEKLFISFFYFVVYMCICLVKLLPYSVKKKNLEYFPNFDSTIYLQIKKAR